MRSLDLRNPGEGGNSFLFMVVWEGFMGVVTLAEREEVE